MNLPVPGEALDASVATKVMGWKQTFSHRDVEAYGAPVNHWCDSDGAPREWATAWYDYNAWSPSTNITNAWKVIERVNALGFVISIEQEHDLRWFVSWWHKDKGNGVSPYTATACEAVCHAALIMVESK